MKFIFKVFIFIAYWVVVPIILFRIFLLSISILKNATNDENRISAKAGFWSGLTLFIFYFIYEAHNFKTPEFKITTFEIDLSGMIVGIIIGFFFLFGIKRFIPTRIVGFILMLLSFSSFSALYSYFFIQTFNTFLLSLTISLAFGVLLHMILWPKSIKEIVGKSEKSSHK